MISGFFSKLKRPSFGNICSPRENLTCIVVAVDARCVCVCVRARAPGGGGGWQYTTSREPPCGRFVRQVPQQSREFVI